MRFSPGYRLFPLFLYLKCWSAISSGTKTQQKPNTKFLVLFGFFLICEKVKLAFSTRFAVYTEPETVFELLFSELSYLHGYKHQA